MGGSLPHRRGWRGRLVRPAGGADSYTETTLSTPFGHAMPCGPQFRDDQPPQVASGEAGAGGSPAARERRRAVRWRATAGMAIAATLALAMIGAGFLYQYAGSGAHQRRVNSELRRKAAGLRKELASAERQMGPMRARIDTQAQVLGVLIAPDTRTIRLLAQPAAPDSAGVAAIDARLHTAVLEATGLPLLAPDKVYVLWWIGARSGAVNAGPFRVGRQGEATVIVAMPPEGERLLGSLITLEPAGSTVRPGGAVCLQSRRTR